MGPKTTATTLFCASIVCIVVYIAGLQRDSYTIIPSQPASLASASVSATPPPATARPAIPPSSNATPPPTATLPHTTAPTLTAIGPLGEHFAVRVLASHMSDPWSVVCGPDHYLWVTEEKTYRVSRLDPSTGERKVILDLAGDRHFPRYDSIGEAHTEKPWPEGG